MDRENSAAGYWGSPEETCRQEACLFIFTWMQFFPHSSRIAGATPLSITSADACWPSLGTVLCGNNILSQGPLPTLSTDWSREVVRGLNPSQQLRSQENPSVSDIPMQRAETSTESTVQFYPQANSAPPPPFPTGVSTETTPSHISCLLISVSEFLGNQPTTFFNCLVWSISAKTPDCLSV